MPPSQPFLAARSNLERRAIQRLLESLRTIATNKSQAELKKLQAEILEYSKFLPGPLTPQKFAGEDDKTDCKMDVIAYSRVLESLTEVFDAHWPMSDAAVRGLFVVDGADCQLMNETLLALTQGMKVTEDERVVKCYGRLLEELVMSDALLSAIVTSSRVAGVSELEKSMEDEIWQNIIQIVVSLPNRVANKMQRRLLDTFKLRNFTNVLSFHIARAIYFLSEARCIQKVEVDTRIISMLLSKMFLLLNSDDLVPLVDILMEWCLPNTNDLQNFLYKILADVDSHSVECIAVLFLKHSKFTPKVLGKLSANDNWRHTLTIRIPLMSWYKDDNLLNNLVSYLLYAQTSDDRILVKLVTKLLDIWGDKSALNHTTFDQHLYITKIIILAVRATRSHLTPTERDEMVKLVFSGIPRHLGSTEVEIRAVGMVTGEVLTEVLINVGEVEKLKFEYDGMAKSALAMVELLRKLEIRDRQEKMDVDVELVVGEMEFSNVGSKKVYELGVECKILKSAFEPKPTDMIASQPKNALTILKESIKHQPTTSEAVEDLDSDDDLVPYDMSNDVDQKEKLKPLYLRDLRDNLINGESKGEEDADIFEQTLRVSEELILAQLPNDDASFACELLEIFMNLTEKCAVDDFEALTFKACVAVVTTHPNPTAEYICKEFHSELSKYSVQQRMLMLDILCESARRLSAVEIAKDDEEDKVLVKKKMKLPKPVSLFIETDKSKKYEILYDDDDFDDPMDESTPTVDWREVVQRRISTNTRHFAHATKLSKTTVNKFGNFVSSFFYPLISGFSSANRSFMYELPRSYRDQENILLMRFLETLAVIMNAAQNCTVAAKMGKEVLELAWTLRYHDEGKLRLAVMKCVAAVLLSVPEFVLRSEMLGAIAEIREWLLGVCQNTFKGDSDSDCKELGRHVMYLVDSIMQGLVQG